MSKSGMQGTAQRGDGGRISDANQATTWLALHHPRKTTDMRVISIAHLQKPSIILRLPI